MRLSLQLRVLCVALTVLASSGCPEAYSPCPPGRIYSQVEEACVADVDASDAGDGGVDAGAVDAGPDAGTDPVCPTDCGDGFCSTEGEEPRCVDCDSTRPCAVSAPVCDDDGACQPCNADPECASRVDTPRCGPAGGCVQCNAEGGCASNESCNLLTNECEPEPADPLSTCEACTNSDQCADGLECFKTMYLGQPHNDHGYCLEPAGSPGVCGNNTGLLYSDPLDPIDGGTAGRACAPDPNFASCEHWLALDTLEPCEGNPNPPDVDGGVDGGLVPGDGRCGIDGADREFAGSLCRESVCTYPCNGPMQCIRRNDEGECSPPTDGGIRYCRAPDPRM